MTSTYIQASYNSVLELRYSHERTYNVDQQLTNTPLVRAEHVTARNGSSIEAFSLFRNLSMTEGIPWDELTENRSCVAVFPPSLVVAGRMERGGNSREFDCKKLVGIPQVLESESDNCNCDNSQARAKRN